MSDPIRFTPRRIVVAAALAAALIVVGLFIDGRWTAAWQTLAGPPAVGPLRPIPGSSYQAPKTILYDGEAQTVLIGEATLTPAEIISHYERALAAADVELVAYTSQPSEGLLAGYLPDGTFIGVVAFPAGPRTSTYHLMSSAGEAAAAAPPPADLVPDGVVPTMGWATPTEGFASYRMAVAPMAARDELLSQNERAGWELESEQAGPRGLVLRFAREGVVRSVQITAMPGGTSSITAFERAPQIP